MILGWVLLSDGTQRGGKQGKTQEIADAPELSPSNLHVKLDDGTRLSAQQVMPEFVTMKED